MYIGDAAPQKCNLLFAERFRKPMPQIKYTSIYLSTNICIISYDKEVNTHPSECMYTYQSIFMIFVYIYITKRYTLACELLNFVES